MRLALLLNGLMIGKVTTNIIGPIPQFPPLPVFNLFNAMHQCIARLQHSYPVSLTPQDLGILMAEISPMLQTNNLTLSRTEPCDFAQQGVNSLLVEFCGDTSNIRYNGVMTLEYIQGSLNATLLRDLLISSTQHDCGIDPTAIGFMSLSLIFWLLLLGVCASQCYARCQQPTAYKQFDRDTSGLFRRGPADSAQPDIALASHNATL